MLKTIFLDLDDTLLDFHKAEAAALTKALTALDVPPTPAVIARYSAINAQQWRLLEEGKFTRDEILTRRFDILFRELGVERSSALARRTYEQFLGQGHIFIPGAEELLKALAPRYALYLVSNGTAAVQAGRIASAGIAPYFKEIFISEAMGLHKPQKAFFDACFASNPRLSQGGGPHHRGQPHLGHPGRQQRRHPHLLVQPPGEAPAGGCPCGL